MQLSRINSSVSNVIFSTTVFFVTQPAIQPAFDRLVLACQATLPVESWARHRVLVAVSGGADSVALFRTMVRLKDDLDGAGWAVEAGIRPEVVHINHAVRGSDADADADFVQALANEFAVGFHQRTLTWAENVPGHGVSENELRNLRYDAILDVARTIGARYVFTGHHQDDQVETILFRIFRGTGLAGLAGIPAIRVVDESVSLVRPLLSVNRASIMEALGELQQGHRADASNDADHYSRNYLRNRLLPEVREYFGPHVDQAMLRLSQHAEDAMGAESAAVDKFLETIGWTADRRAIELPVARLKGLKASILRAVLLRLWKHNRWPVGDMTYEHWCLISALVQERTCDTVEVRNLPGNVRLEIDANTLRLKPLNDATTE